MLTLNPTHNRLLKSRTVKRMLLFITPRTLPNSLQHARWAPTSTSPNLYPEPWAADKS